MKQLCHLKYSRNACLLVEGMDSFLCSTHLLLPGRVMCVRWCGIMSLHDKLGLWLVHLLCDPLHGSWWGGCDDPNEYHQILKESAMWTPFQPCLSSPPWTGPRPTLMQLPCCTRSARRHWHCGVVICLNETGAGATAGHGFDSHCCPFPCML